MAPGHTAPRCHSGPGGYNVQMVWPRAWPERDSVFSQPQRMNIDMMDFIQSHIFCPPALYALLSLSADAALCHAARRSHSAPSDVPQLRSKQFPKYRFACFNNLIELPFDATQVIQTLSHTNVRERTTRLTHHQCHCSLEVLANT